MSKKNLNKTICVNFLFCMILRTAYINLLVYFLAVISPIVPNEAHKRHGERNWRSIKIIMKPKYTKFVNKKTPKNEYDIAYGHGLLWNVHICNIACSHRRHHLSDVVQVESLSLIFAFLFCFYWPWFWDFIWNFVWYFIKMFSSDWVSLFSYTATITHVCWFF